jgi:hypothetical protein
MHPCRFAAWCVLTFANRASTPDDVSGGNVGYELGTSVHDTVELRDVAALSGDVESVSATELLVRVGGTDPHINRTRSNGSS